MAAPHGKLDMSLEEDDSSLLLEALNIPATYNRDGESKNARECNRREYNELF